MAAGWPRQIHDDLEALLALLGPSVPRTILLTQKNGRGYAVIVAHLVSLEEDKDGNTDVHTTDGRDVTVTEDILTILALIAA